jgi:hypothetical protein
VLPGENVSLLVSATLHIKLKITARINVTDRAVRLESYSLPSVRNAHKETEKGDTNWRAWAAKALN